MRRLPPTSTLFPYTTLFRSERDPDRVQTAVDDRAGADVALADVDRQAEDGAGVQGERSEEHTSELQSQSNLVCRLLLEKKNGRRNAQQPDYWNHATAGWLCL